MSPVKVLEVALLCCMLAQATACGADPIMDRANAERAEESNGQGGAGHPGPGQANGPIPGDPSQPPPGQAAQPPPGAPPQPEPGVPNQPQPGTPDDQVEATAGTPDGPTITLSGTVRYGDYGKGTIRVDVFDGDQSDRSLAQRPGVVAWADMESPGAFSVQLPVSKGKVWLSAFNDANGDGKPDHEDPGGQCQDNPMVVGNQDISGVVIDLQYNPKPADQ